MKNLNDGLRSLQPAVAATSVTTAATTYQQCRAVYVGTAQSLDFYVTNDGVGTQVPGWVTFQGLAAGAIYPICALGARLTAGGAAPNAGDVVFLN